MEYLYKIGLAWAFVAYVIYSVVTHILRERYYARKAIEWGTQPVPENTSFAHRWTLGINLIIKALSADRRMKFPDFIMERNKKMDFRVCRYSVLGTENITANHPENVKALLATQFHDFSLGHLRRGNFFPLLGNGIFTSDGKYWEHSRTMMRPQFAREQVSDLDLEERHVQDFMRALPTDSSGWTAQVDLQPLFFRLTLDSACEFLFGESVDSQLASLPENTGSYSHSKSFAFANAFDAGQRQLATRARFNAFYWVADGLRFRKDCRICHDFIDHFVRKALDKTSTEKELEAGGKKSDRYIFLDALAAQTRDPIELRTQLLNILLAGRDTTASLLGFVFFELARHPEVYAKLRATVLEEFGPYQVSPSPASLPSSNQQSISFSKLKSCTLLQHVINETSRLHPVVPFNARCAEKDTTLPRGGGPDGQGKILVRKGQLVEYSIFVVHRMKEYWGEDAEEWKPERWAGRKPGWEYLPFNGGPRICLGQQFALTEASYVAVRLLQKFDSLQQLDFEDVAYDLTLTASSGRGVKVRLHEAGKA